MKRFSNLINLPQERKHSDFRSIYGKTHYVGNKEVILTEYAWQNSFENFLKDNNITEITEDTYRFYLDQNFKDGEYEISFTPTSRWYSSYQNHLYESINRSYDTLDFVEEISKIAKYDKVEYVKKVKPKSDNHINLTQFSIYFSEENIKKLDDEWEKLLSLMHRYNYYCKGANLNKGILIFEPYKPKEETNYIYNECKGIVYHVTSKDVYNKIINAKEITKRILKPHKITDTEFRDGRLFFIANPNEKEVKFNLRSIANTGKIKDPVFLKIDLNKYRFKLIFRIDSSAFGYKAYFTEEPIPSYCLEKIDLEQLK